MITSKYKSIESGGYSVIPIVAGVITGLLLPVFYFVWNIVVNRNFDLYSLRLSILLAFVFPVYLGYVARVVQTKIIQLSGTTENISFSKFKRQFSSHLLIITILSGLSAFFSKFNVQGGVPGYAWLGLLFSAGFPVVYIIYYFLLIRVSSKQIGLKFEIAKQRDSINKVRDFAEKIGTGKLDVEYEVDSKADSLGNALIKMRDNLRMSAQNEKDREWTIEGIAKLSEILRKYNDLTEFAYHVTVFIVNKINAVQGAFYILEGDDANKAVIKMIASYAYSRKKYLNSEFKIGEGLVGQAVFERDYIYRTDLPNNYSKITSGILGEQKPKSLLVLPLISNDIIYGAIELSSLSKLSPLQINFIKQISEILGQTIFNLQVNDKTAKLLDEVNKSQKRMQILLENASEVITIYEQDLTTRYVSPSVERILGYDQKDLLGINGTKYIHPKGLETFNKMFQDLLENPNQVIQTQFSHYQKNGERIWMEATGKNLLSDPAIQGIVVNTRDITMKRKADKEEKKSGQMQALSENSPDLIMRVSKERTFFYINPSIERFTSKPASYFLQKQLNEVELDGAFVNSLDKMIEEVMTTGMKTSMELTYSGEAKVILHVNAMPETNGNDAVETVLIVAHDITQAKLIQQEIQSTNKKITESINYAQRIQQSILPNEATVTGLLPDSFMFYKPRDIVSGDFPWFHQTEEELYLGVVDCTGHGVPGALMSLIGHFVLNECMNDNHSLTPSVLLDKLHEGVKQTLKQEENRDTRDGMDIAMCKIHKNKNYIEYSGAHRPMYHVRGDVITEYKGDKCPIGGVQYKNRDVFTNHKVEVQKGDTIYIFSDGLPDQIGGPEGKKLMVGQIKELIVKNYDRNMPFMKEIFETEFENWKGKYKQVDDVLLIGIRF